MAIETGHTFGRYRVQSLLGQGGFASVYLAFDPALARQVAIKVLHADLSADPHIAARFQAEAQQLARMRHPNIVGVHDVGDQDGRPYFAMDHLEGITLSAFLERKGSLTLAEVVHLALQLGAALDYLHSIGIIHRDLKPSNIMVDGSGHLTLMDFGVARAVDRPGMTATGGVLGTPLYMSPEQVRGLKVEAPADIYAMAVVLYQLLAGRPPFEGDTLSVMHQQASEAPPPLGARRPGLPAQVYAAIGAGLAKDVAQRPRTAGQLATTMAEGARQAGMSPPWPLAAIPHTPIGVPPITPRPTPAGTSRAPLPATVVAGRTPAAVQSPVERRTSRLPYLLAGGGAALAVAAILVIAVLASASGKPTKKADAAGATGTASPTPTVAAAVPSTVTPTPTAVVTPQIVAPAITVSPPPATKPPTVPTQPPAPPPPVVPGGDYRMVQNSGDAKCIRGRSAPGTGGQIYVCVRDGFIVRLTSDPPQTVDGYVWYNAEGIGWMAAQELQSGVSYLRQASVPASPAFEIRQCWLLNLQTTIAGSYQAPPSLRFCINDSRGPAFATGLVGGGSISGWFYGSQVFLKYQTTLNGRAATGTLVLLFSGDPSGPAGYWHLSGDFAATAFQTSGSNGAYGIVSGGPVLNGGD